MNYEEKYKQALERAKKLYEQGTTTESLGYVFPELNESYNEKIRKELIEHIKANKEADYVLFKKFSPDDVIAWLEKQGEKKNTRKREIDDAYLQGMCDAKQELEKQSKQFNYESKRVN